MPKAERFSFTKEALDTIEPPETGRRSVWDVRVPKLCLRVTDRGAKTFYFVTRLQTDDGPRTEWVRLGRYPGLDIDGARDAALVAASQFARGTNPAEDKRHDKAEWTVGKAWEEYRKFRTRKLEAAGRSEEKIARSLEAHGTHWNLHYSKWDRRRLSAISEGMTESLQDTVFKNRSGATTNRVIASGRAVFNFAIKRKSSGFDGPNPFSDLEHLPEVRRKEKLRRNQIPDFFAALDSVSEQMQDFFLLGLWTGRRAGDVKSMRWVDLDLDIGTWLIPDPKSGEPQEAALSLPAIEILSRRKRSTKGVWVFPSRSKSGHIEEYKKAWQKLRTDAGLGKLRFHDLRRTLSSFAQENRIAATVAGAQLGHKDPATTFKHYTDIALYAQREAVNVVANAILEAKDSD